MYVNEAVAEIILQDSDRKHPWDKILTQHR